MLGGFIFHYFYSSPLQRPHALYWNTSSNGMIHEKQQNHARKSKKHSKKRDIPRLFVVILTCLLFVLIFINNKFENLKLTENNYDLIMYYWEFSSSSESPSKELSWLSLMIDFILFSFILYLHSSKNVCGYYWQTNTLDSFLGCFAMKIFCDFVIIRFYFGL